MEDIIRNLKVSIKEGLYLALKSSIGISTVAIFIVWFYLFSLGRQDVFLDVINNIPSMIVIVIFSFLIMVMFFSLFVSSSFVTIFSFKLYQKEIGVYKGFGSHLTIICVYNSILFWCGFFFLFLCFEKKWPDNGYLHFLSFVVATMLTAANSYRMLSKKLLKSSNFEDLNITKTYIPFHRKLVEKFLLSAILLAPAWVQIFPLLFIFPRLDFGEIHNDYAQLGMVMLLVIIISVFTMLPAVAWFSASQERGYFYKFRDIFLAMIFVVFIIFTVFRSFSDVVVNSSLRLVGITDWHAHHYYISNDKFSPALFPGNEWNTRTYSKIPQRFFITGVPVFSLGNVQLICPVEILAFRERSMRENISDLSSSQLRVTELKHYSSRCHAFQKGDAMQWDTELNDPIYLEKIKTSYNNNLIRLLHLIK
ncbi:hypothetical protein [Pantoea sp. SM3]|uniref:hypothetical protein n=1 Tax=Pantoea sp. SM3 TaxID=1628192 RepID=UPI0005F7E5CA|nr:hypothetical protein [Pantoea sp. SM3]KJV32367.1 hypothetical protein VI01_08535 [Pantoea sp. SM3]